MRNSAGVYLAPTGRRPFDNVSKERHAAVLDFGRRPAVLASGVLFAGIRHVPDEAPRLKAVLRIAVYLELGSFRLDSTRA